MNFLNDSREIQDVESICTGRLSHVPSQPAIVPSLGVMLSRDQSLRTETWNLFGTSGNVFDSPRAVICYRRKPSARMYRENLSLEVKKEIERRLQRRDLQGDHQP